MKIISKITTELIDSMASDETVVRAARVSTGTDSKGLEQGGKGLINYLMRDRHGSPFEHSTFTFRVHAPIFVFRELMRHRIASYNEESGRYMELQPVFYAPDENRNLVQVGKPGAYEFEAGTAAQYFYVLDAIQRNSSDSYERYLELLSQGVAREVARMVLPLNIFSSAYVTINARSLMNLVSLRVKSSESTYPSFPQREIEMMAEEMEKHLKDLMPFTHEAFVNNGRVAP